MTAIATRPSSVGSSVRKSNTAPIQETQPMRMGQEISGRLCAVYVSVSRPTGSVKLRDAVVEHENKGGEKVTLSSKYVRKPSVQYDFDQLWGDIDDNEKKIRRLVHRFTASNLQRGTYLMSMLQVGTFVIELRNLMDDRKELVKQLRKGWTKVLRGIANEHKDIYHVIQAQIPYPTDDRFRVEYEMYPMGALNADDLDLTNLSEAERKTVIEQTQAHTSQMFQSRFKNILDGVFGEVVELCKEVEAGKFERKPNEATIRDVLDTLARVKNFREWADAATLKHIDDLEKTLASVSDKDIRANAGNVQLNLRAMFMPLRQQIESQIKGYEAGTSRAERTVELA